MNRKLGLEHWKRKISGTANKQLFSGPSTDYHLGTGQNYLRKGREPSFSVSTVNLIGD